MRRRLAALAAALALVLACPAAAQSDDGGSLATLLADRVEIDADTTITATGNVEVFQEGVRLTAASITYDRSADRLTIEGPITLVEDGESVILADSAELDADFRNGIVRGARMILDQELQIAAPRIDRAEGRYTRLSRAVASSCRICAEDERPLWEIRARRVTHDRETRQLYFEGAQFRVAGIPLAYVPRLRIPDPTVERATGFLFPRLRSSTLLGTGIRTPYFIVLGDHADVLLTPFLTPETTTLEVRYRQELSFGSFTIDAAASTDTLVEPNRAYLFADARFRLPEGFEMRADLELVSDRSYLDAYDFSGKDRLDSAVAVFRTSRDQDIYASATGFRTLRASEIPIRDQVTGRLLEGRFTQRLPTGALGGAAWLEFDASSLIRPSQLDVSGRDVARIGIGAQYRRGFTFGPGVVAETGLGYETALYNIRNDSTFEEIVARRTPWASATLRWPLQRTGADGSGHLLEPAVSLTWSETRGEPVPNEDSTLVDFDEGNIFALTRFPGADAREEGLRAAALVRYLRYAPDGWTLGATVGRIVEQRSDARFADVTGLTGTSSDWLLAFEAGWKGQLQVLSRTLLRDTDDITRSETRLAWASERLSLATIYTYARDDPTFGRPDPTSEWTLDAAYRLTPNWLGRVNWRYDTDEGRATDAALEVRYENECVRVDVSLSRDFTQSATVDSATEFEFEVAFGGFGASNSRTYRRSCTG